MTNQPPPQVRQEWKKERWELLHNLHDAIEKPMIALAFVWLGLLVLDFTTGLDPLLQTLSNVIWAVFILNFVIEIVIAPDKLEYLRRNWLTAISLVVPAFRIFRVFRAVRLLQATRTVRMFGLVRLVSSVNRGMRAIQNVLGRRGIGTVIVLTIVIVFTGAAGMYAFENSAALEQAGHDDARAELGLSSYGEAVWWTAMIMTTLGSDYWPQTAEGRVVCWLLSLYALAVFGYITATVASYFIGSDAKTSADTQVLREELAALRAEVAALSARSEPRSPDTRL